MKNRIDLSAIVLAAVKHEFATQKYTISFDKWGVNLCATETINGYWSNWSVWSVENLFLSKKLFGDERTTAHACAEFIRDRIMERLSK